MSTGQEAFGALVQDRLALKKVPIDVCRLHAGDVSTADVRLAGGMILHAVLEGEHGPVTVLTSNAADYSEYARPKLDASFPMGPVGPNEGPGGKHGAQRWLGHNVVDESHRQAISLVAEVPYDSPVTYGRKVMLRADRLLVVTSVANQSNEPLATSLGEHLYFDLPVEPTDDNPLRVDWRSLGDVVGARVQDDVMAGRAQVWSEYDGNACFSFPDGKHVAVRSHLTLSDGRTEETPHMLLWRRPGTPTVCLEPVAGLALDHSAGAPTMKGNAELIVPPNASVAMLTSIRLLDAA